MPYDANDDQLACGEIVGTVLGAFSCGEGIVKVFALCREGWWPKRTTANAIVCVRDQVSLIVLAGIGPNERLRGFPTHARQCQWPWHQNQHFRSLVHHPVDSVFFESRADLLIRAERRHEYAHGDFIFSD